MNEVTPIQPPGAANVRERPILFSAPMVCALLDGSKTQTRRVIKSQPAEGAQLQWLLLRPNAPGSAAYWSNVDDRGIVSNEAHASCPYGMPGDRLWVREAFARIDGQTRHWIETDYRATYKHGDRLGDTLGVNKRWTPSIHMPRHASRITLEIADVRVERLQDISRGDAMDEGCPFPNMARGPDPRQWYAELWDSINGADAWRANPWVWVIEFRTLTNAQTQAAAA